MTIALDPALFRQLFPEFAAAGDDLLAARWAEATGYVDADSGCELTDDTRTSALRYMMAHLMRLASMMAQAATTGGLQATGVVTAASVDKVSVTLAPPPSRDEWGYWLAQTPYGQQLAALLRVQSAGGFYVGGSPERDAFRRAYGVF